MDKTLELELKSFSLRLLPSDSHLEKKRETADMLFELLRKKSRYTEKILQSIMQNKKIIDCKWSFTVYYANRDQVDISREYGRIVGYVDRCYIFGSTGKKTDLGTTFDLDLVIFINDMEPPFDKVFKDFAFIIKRFARSNKSYKLHYLWIRRSLNAIELKLNDFEIHIFPAPNYVNHCSQKPKIKELAAYQAYLTFEKIKSKPMLANLLRPALCEAHIEFVRKNTSSVIHELIRLCKYWDKQIHVTGYIEDRDTLIELIVIKAGREFFTMLKGLEKFLNLMENFQELQVEFVFNPLREKGNKKIEKTSLGKRLPPFVMDPANPFYNVADGVNTVQRKQFSEAAVETNVRLEKWRQGQLKEIEEIFEQNKNDIN